MHLICMKKIVSACLVCLTIASSLHANEPAAFRPTETRDRNEIAVSYGAASLPTIIFTIGGIFATVFTFGLAAPDHMASTGTIGVEYFHYFNNHVAVGVDLTSETYMLSFKNYAGKDADGNAIYKPGSKSYTSMTSIMPAVKVPWFNTRHVGMYSKAAFGGMLAHSDRVSYSTTDENGNVTTTTNPATNQFSWATQITPIALEVGGRSLRGYAEIGFGMQGTLLAGLKYSF